MNDFTQIAARIDSYERHYADISSALDVLAAERDAIISDGKRLGFFAARLQASLPRVPKMKPADEQAEARPEEEPAMLAEDDSLPPTVTVPGSGGEAFRRGICANNNPFPPESDGAKRWLAEWTHAQDATARPVERDRGGTAVQAPLHQPAPGGFPAIAQE